MPMLFSALTNINNIAFGCSSVSPDIGHADSLHFHFFFTTGIKNGNAGKHIQKQEEIVREEFHAMKTFSLSLFPFKIKGDHNKIGRIILQFYLQWQ
jgi:hypothetical protein